MYGGGDRNGRDPILNWARGRTGKNMDISLLLKVAGVGFLIATSALILNKSGRDEQAMLLTVTGIVVVMLMLVGEIGELIGKVRDVFGI